MAADFLDHKRSEIDARLRELKPLECQRLELVVSALQGVSATSAKSASRPRQAPARKSAAGLPGRQRDSATSERRARPKRTNTRAAEALALVTASPGITMPELAQMMGIKQNYLYRVLPALAADGLITVAGRSWYPTRAE